MQLSGSHVLIIDDALERRACLQQICGFLELQCHVFDFVTWLQQGKTFDLAPIAVVFLGESSLPISLNKLIADLNDQGRVLPKALVCDWSELSEADFEKAGGVGHLNEPYSYTAMLDLLHCCFVFSSQQIAPSYPELASLVGQSPSILEVKRLVAQVAPRDISVLITGESGTGKELVPLLPKVMQRALARVGGAIAALVMAYFAWRLISLTQDQFHTQLATSGLGIRLWYLGAIGVLSFAVSAVVALLRRPE